jgi:flagellar biosynthesis protein FlhG
MRDQAYKLRTLAHRVIRPRVQVDPTITRVIAITSGKGGVGKTNLSVNLGLALARMGKRVFLFDADLGLANVEVLLGLNPPHTLYDVLYRGKRLEDVVVTGPFNLQIIPGGTGIQELANLDSSQRERLIDMLSYLRTAEFLLIDTGAGISRSVLGFVAAAREVILVVTPEPTSLTDAYSLIKILARYKVHSEIGLVINRAASEREAAEAAVKLQLVCGKFLRFTVRHIGSIAEDPVVIRAVKNQEPFVLVEPNSVAAREVEAIARYLLSGEIQPAAGAVDSFIGRLFRLFR